MDPTPFLRGNAFPPTRSVPYPRADLSDSARLPLDTVGMAGVPAGVRLELIPRSERVVVAYETKTEDLGVRGDGGGRSFQMWQGGELVAEDKATLGEGTATLEVARRGEPAIVYLPEGMKPHIRDVDADAEPAPLAPRWVCYGDSIAEGWWSSHPSGAWPAIVAREHHLDLVNMGYAGAARGEIVSAEHVASLDAAVISISHGTNCWNRIAHSPEQMYANTLAFIAVIRARRPVTPILVCSPLLRPEAEETPNMLGATLADLRLAMESAVEQRIDAGDPNITLVGGLGVLGDGMLHDEVHPNDAGHRAVADALGPLLHEMVGH